MTQSPERSSGSEAARQQVGEWLASPQWHGQIGALLERDTAYQADLEYVHTQREICQQPVTWAETAAWSRALRSTNGPEEVAL